MIIQVINEFGRFENVLWSAIVSFEAATARRAGVSVPVLILHTTSGRRIKAQHETTETFRVRYNAAKGGLPAVVNGHDDKRLAEIGDLRPLDAFANWVDEDAAFSALEPTPQAPAPAQIPVVDSAINPPDTTTIGQTQPLADSSASPPPPPPPPPPRGGRRTQ